MKKFYNDPAMNISYFAMEKVATEASSVPQPEKLSANDKLLKANNLDGAAVVRITF